MIPVKYRIFNREEKKMYHFVEGFINNIWIAKVHTYEGEKLKVICDENIDAMPFINRYDDTKWQDLDPDWEIEFWARKGYTKKNWRGKEIYLGDITKVIDADGVEKIARIVQSEHVSLFQDPTWCIKEIPFNRDRVSTYVIGNIYQNNELFEIGDPVVKESKH